MTEVLPLFPLPLVLLPTTPQLLHVFEPRYRQLLSDCQAGEGRFGLSRLAAKESDPRPGDVGCSALINTHQGLPDGRSNILVVGERRFVIEDLIESETLYHEGRVHYFDDTDRNDPDLGALAKTLWEGFRKLRDTQAQAAPDHDPSNHPADLSFFVAMALELSLDEKERMLRTTSARERLQHLKTVVTAETEAARTQAAMTERAQGNGRGDHPPNLDSP